MTDERKKLITTIADELRDVGERQGALYRTISSIDWQISVVRLVLLLSDEVCGTKVVDVERLKKAMGQ